MSPRAQSDLKFVYDLDFAAKEASLSAAHKDEKIGEKEMWKDEFDGAEAGGLAMMFVFYGVAWWLLFKLGLTMDILVGGIMFSTIWEVTVAKWNIQYGHRTLRLRDLKETGAEMQKRQPASNPFQNEEAKAFIHFGDHLDYAVMKYVGEEVPMIVEQEYQHATMHHSAQKEDEKDEEHLKWMEKNESGLNLIRKLVLRRSDRVGRLICGMFEAGNVHGLLFQAVTGFNPSMLMQFHCFEEVEHSALTVQCLKKQTTAIERFLAFPFIIGMWLPNLPVTIISIFWNEPSLLFKMETYPQLFWHSWKFFVGMTSTSMSILLHWVLPVPIPQNMHEITHSFFERSCRGLGVEWEVTKEVTYPLYL